MLDELWQEFQRETKQYKDSTEERKLRFEALKKKDDESARTIARQMRKLQKLTDSISVLRQRMASNAKESELKTRAIKEVRERERERQAQVHQCIYLSFFLFKHTA